MFSFENNIIENIVYKYMYIKILKNQILNTALLIQKKGIRLLRESPCIHKHIKQRL